MKKIVFVILFLAACGLSGMAQSGIYSGGVSEVAKHDLRKTGWIVRPEIGYAAHVGEGYYDRCDSFITFSAKAGYQISPQIYFWGGLGCFVGLDKYYKYYDNTGFYGYHHDKAIPLSAGFRWYWFDGRSSPFLDLDVGGGISKIGNGVNVSYFINPAIGYDIRNFDIKITVPIFSNYIGVGIAIGYNFLVKK